MSQGFAESVDTSSSARLADKVWWRGFLANRGELLTELGLPPSTPDERVVAQAYRRWGAGLQAHLLGEYALAVWDPAADSLLLTHDALGVVPLYYAVRGHTIYFGTHLSLLVKLMPGTDLDDGYVAEFLLRGECLSERTIYRDIRRLGVGRTLLCAASRAKEMQTWSLGELPELRYRDPGDYDEHFRELVRAAVRTAVDGRTWSELSGGLDSSTIACVAHDLGVQDFATVSVVYPASATSDELSWIRIVESKKGIRGYLVDGDEHQPFSVLPDRSVEEPSRLHVTWPVFTEYETLLRDNGVEVLLSGFGGDQVFFAEADYPIQVADDVRRLRLGSAVRHVARWSPTASERSLTHRVLNSAALPAWNYLRGNVIRDQYVRADWLSPSLPRCDDAVRAPTPRMPTVRGQAFYEQIWRMACSAGQSWGHNTTAARWRYPLLYRPLVEFMSAVPPQQQVAPSRDRLLQRRALTGILPDEIRTRRTKSSPAQAIYHGLRANRDVYQLLTDRPLIAQRGYVDQVAWRAAVQAAQFGVVRSSAAFEAAVSLELWLRQREKQL